MGTALVLNFDDMTPNTCDTTNTKHIRWSLMSFSYIRSCKSVAKYIGMTICESYLGSLFDDVNGAHGADFYE